MSIITSVTEIRYPGRGACGSIHHDFRQMSQSERRFPNSSILSPLFFCVFFRRVNMQKW